MPKPDADDAGLVERLRNPKFYTPSCCPQASYLSGFHMDDMEDAADLIESQRREIEELRRRFENQTPVGYRYLYPHHDGRHYWEFSNGKEINAVKPVRGEPVYSSPHAFAEAGLLARAEKAEAALANEREYRKAFQQATVENARDINEHHEMELATARSEGFAAGLEAGAEMIDGMGPATQDMTSTHICWALAHAATALRERAREEKAK